jgi:anti-sigma factor RsiW
MRAITWLRWGSHGETERHLSEYVEGEVRGFRRGRIVRHLARCEPCAAVFRSLQRTIELLRGLGQREPIPVESAAEAVVARIRRDQERRP